MRAAHLSPVVPPSVAGGESLVLVSHGSRDPEAGAATRALAAAVRQERPGLDVRVSYLDHTPPSPGRVLHEVQSAGQRAAVVVPLLLTAAYHRRVDVPGAVAAARAAGMRLPVRITGVLGPAADAVDPLLLAALRRRLAEAAGPRTPDGVVLAAAGTRDAPARRTVDAVADALGAALGVPCVAAYASAAGPTVDVAVDQLRAAGAHRIAMAAYFLAPGHLHTVAGTAARAAGAVAVATPLRDAPELARLVLARAGC